MQWLNKLVGEAWPFYDRAICDIIKETVTPIMEQYKPPLIIKSMYFMNLTFGDAPIQVDSVWIEQEAENHILMEVGLLACRMPLGVVASGCMMPAVVPG